MDGWAAPRRGRKLTSPAPKILPASRRVLSDQPRSRRATEPEIRRQEDKAAGRREERKTWRQEDLISPSPWLRFSLSLTLLVSLSSPLSLSRCLGVSAAWLSSQSSVFRFRS